MRIWVNCLIRKMKLLISAHSQSLVEKCVICLQNIISDGIPHEICSSYFHRDHLASWFVLGYQNCPYCKYPFGEDIIQELNPKSKEELDRLLKISEVFGKPETKRIIYSKPRKKKPKRNGPRIMHSKWLVYLYRVFTLVPVIFLSLFSLFFITISFFIDLAIQDKILVGGMVAMFLISLVSMKKTYKAATKKVIYQPKMS